MVRVDLVDVTTRNIGLVKLLHQKCFPVEYPEAYFAKLSTTPDLVKLGFVADCLVAVVGCKLDEPSCLYLMTLGVLSHYRGQGIATQLLEWATTRATSAGISRLALHVQVSNTEAIDFYSKRGFVIESTDPQYYPQLVPTAAHYMVKRLD